MSLTEKTSRFHRKLRDVFTPQVLIGIGVLGTGAVALNFLRNGPALAQLSVILWLLDIYWGYSRLEVREQRALRVHAPQVGFGMWVVGSLYWLTGQSIYMVTQYFGVMALLAVLVAVGVTYATGAPGGTVGALIGATVPVWVFFPAPTQLGGVIMATVAFIIGFIGVHTQVRSPGVVPAYLVGVVGAVGFLAI